MSGKVTVLAPNEPDPLPRLHDGWGKAKRKLDTTGAIKTEMGRLYRRAAAGHLDADDLKTSIWALRQLAEVSEKAELEQRIADLEAKLEEAIQHGR